MNKADYESERSKLLTELTELEELLATAESQLGKLVVDEVQKDSELADEIRDEIHKLETGIAGTKGAISDLDSEWKASITPKSKLEQLERLIAEGKASGPEVTEYRLLKAKAVIERANAIKAEKEAEEKARREQAPAIAKASDTPIAKPTPTKPKHSASEETTTPKDSINIVENSDTTIRVNGKQATKLEKELEYKPTQEEAHLLLLEALEEIKKANPFDMSAENFARWHYKVIATYEAANKMAQERNITVIKHTRERLQKEDAESKQKRIEKAVSKTPEAKKAKKAKDKERAKWEGMAEMWGVEVTDAMTNGQIKDALKKAMA